MKKILIALFIVSGIIGLGYVALTVVKKNTKKHSPEANSVYSAEGVDIRVAYCQPSKKGREIFGNLVPYDIVWRTGANEATVFTTSHDLQFAEGILKAGSYSLFSIPKENEDWLIVFNKEIGQWGTQYAESADVLRVKAKQEPLGTSMEVFDIAIETRELPELVIKWDMTQVILPLQAIK
jgi:hypothetical protein